MNRITDIRKEEAYGRLDERLKGLEKSVPALEQFTEEKFEAVLDKINERCDGIDKKLDILWDQNNVNKGALSTLRIGGGAVWGLLGGIAALLGDYFMRRG